MSYILFVGSVVGSAAIPTVVVADIVENSVDCSDGFLVVIVAGLLVADVIGLSLGSVLNTTQSHNTKSIEKVHHIHVYLVFVKM